MPTYFARVSGNVNATNIWATTPTGTASAVTLTASDVLVSNSFTVTLNVNTTVAEVRNDNFSGATAGGSFTLSNGVTLTANIVNGFASGTVNISGANSGTIVGNATCTVGSAITQSGTGNLTIVGNMAGGTGQSCHCVSSSTSGLLNITGTCNAGTGVSACGVFWSGAGTCNITGACNGGNNSNVSANGAQSSSTIGTMNIYGTATGGATGHGAANVQAGGTMFVQRAKGNGFGNGSAGLNAVPGVSASFTNSITRVAEFEFGDLGQTPTAGPIILSDSTSNVVLLYRPSLSKKTLTDPAATVAFPSASDVRLGVAYNSGSQVGTLAVPMASQVAVGVAVGNTTGTAALTPAAVWDAATSGIAASGSIGERLKNAATVASTGQQLADALAGL